MKPHARKKTILFSLLALAVAGVAAWALLSDRTDDRDAFLGLERVLATGTAEEIRDVADRIRTAPRVKDIAGYPDPRGSRKTRRVFRRIQNAALSRLDGADDPETAAAVLRALEFFRQRLWRLECPLDFLPSEDERQTLLKAVDFLKQQDFYSDWALYEWPTGLFLHVDFGIRIRDRPQPSESPAKSASPSAP